MTATKKFINFIITSLLVISFFWGLILIDFQGPSGSASGGYVGFTEDNRINDDLTSKEQSAVAMATYNNEIYLVWHDMRNNDFDIFFTKSTDGGASWGDGQDNNNDIRVDDTDINANQTDNSTQQKYPDIAVDSSGNIYVVWQDNREGPGDFDIYLAKSTDGGASFETNVRVDHNGTGTFDQLNPTIAIDSSDNIYIAWEDERNGKTDFDIFFTKSGDGGANFQSPDVQVDDDTGTGLQKFPKIAVLNKNPTPELYIVWQDERQGLGNFDVYFSKSTDGGATWGDGSDNNNDILVNDNTIFGQENPDMAIDGNGDIIIVWDDGRAGNYKNLYYSRSTDGGASFGTNVKMFDAFTNSTDQTNPVIAAKGENVTIAWLDNRNGVTQTDIFFSISSDSGSTYGPFLKADQGGINTVQSEPDILIKGQNTVYLAWEDNRNGTRGRDIFFAKSSLIVLLGPNLTDPGFSPKQGISATDFLFTVVYTDPENDPPDNDYPKLYIFKDSAGTDPYPGSPFKMFRQEVPWQDGLFKNGEIFEKRIPLNGEYDYHYYIETKALYGNTTMVKTNLAKGPVIDQSFVSFSNAYPEDDIWHNTTLIECGITIIDVGFADIDPLNISYRFMLNGTETFSQWKNAYIEYEKIQGGYNVSVDISFDEGSMNFFQWRSTDKFGNGPNESAIIRIKIDRTPVAFSDPIPDPKTYWSSTEVVETGIRATDKWGSGVNGSTLEYAYSTTGPGNFGEWINAGITSSGEDITVKVNVPFANGTSNYIKWRGNDLMGNGPTESDVYQVKVDTTLSSSKDNHVPAPPVNVKPVKTVDRTPVITWEEGSDADGDSLIYFIMIGSSVNGSDFLDWTGVGGKLLYQVIKNFNVGTYYIHLKSFDGRDYSNVSITALEISNDGNSPPSPPTEISPLYTSDQYPIISWSGADDPDGDPDKLTYYVQIGSSLNGEDILPLSWNGYTASYEIKNKPLEYGLYYIKILVFDGQDWSEPASFVVKIADYELGMTGVSSVSIMQGQTRAVELNITNLGSYDDTVTLSYSDALSGQANLNFSDESLVLNAGGEKGTELSITTLIDAEVKDYYLRITATSEDGVTVAEHTIIVIVTSTTSGKPNGDPVDGTGDDKVGSPLENLLEGGFFWLIIIIIIIVVVIVAYFVAKSGRRKKEEERLASERSKRDEMYSEPPPPTPPLVGYDYYGAGAQRGYPYQQGMPPQQPPAPEVYYDENGTPRESPAPPEQAAEVMYPEHDQMYEQVEHPLTEQPMPETPSQVPHAADEPVLDHEGQIVDIEGSHEELISDPEEGVHGDAEAGITDKKPDQIIKKEG